MYLNVEIKSHSFYQFEGDNLLCEVPITPDEAVLGTSIEVPTPDGIVTILFFFQGPEHFLCVLPFKAKRQPLLPSTLGGAIVVSLRPIGMGCSVRW